jgi:hypothetical protein
MLDCRDGRLRATVDGKEAFTATAGARIVTTLDGRLIKVVGIDPRPRRITVGTKVRTWTLTVGPNRGYRLDRPEAASIRTAPFDGSS